MRRADRLHYRTTAMTLVEILVVITIITTLLGASMAGISTALKRSSGDSAPNLVAIVHQSLATLARSTGRGGRVYGYHLTYVTNSGPTTRPAASSLTPWYFDYPPPSGGSAPTLTTFTSVEALYNVVGSVNLASLTTGTPPVAYYDLTGSIMPCQAGSSPYRNIYLNGTPLGATLANGDKVYITFEPGTGYVHYQKNVDPASAYPNLSTLMAESPKQIDINFFTASTGVPAQRITLFQNGLYDIKSPL